MPALPSASACPLRDWGPPEGQPTPTKETQRSKRPSSQQVLTGRGLWLAEGGGLRTGLRSDPLWVRGLGKIISLFHIPGAEGKGWREPAGAGPSLPEGREGPVTGSPRLTLHSGPAQENPDSRAQKRPCPSASAPVLAEAKDNISASGQGTMNPTAPGSRQLSAPSISLKVAANIVVKCLTPFYKEGKFASKVGHVVGAALPWGWDTWVQWACRSHELQGRSRLAPRPAVPLPWAAVPLGYGSWLLKGQGRGLCSLLLFTMCLQELFKAFARHLSHSLTQTPSPGRSGECLHCQARRHLGGSAGWSLALTFSHSKSVVKEEAQNLIKQFFHGRARCESEADWHGLCGPQS